MEYVPSPKQIEREIGAHLDKTAKTVEIHGSVDPFRLYFLRPSSFPYCGLQFFLRFPSRLDTPKSESLSSAYFTSVGTATHDTFQRYTSKLGKVVADWECTNKKCDQYKVKVKFTTYQPCKSCGKEMKHHELEFFYKKTLIGHSDALYRFSPNLGNKSKHAVNDYKTTSKKNVDADAEAESKGNKRIFPYKSNVAQIQTYIPLIEHQYKVSVDYWILIYLARDAPFQYGRRIVVKYVNEEAKEKLRKQLDKTIKIHRRVLTAKSEEDVAVIRKHKLCKSLEDYKKNWKGEYEDCPFIDVCFKDTALTKTIRETMKKHKKVFPIIENAPDKVRKKLDL